MCFNPEQKAQIDAGHILVMFVFNAGDRDHYAVTGGFITPAGLRDADTAINMFGTLTGEVLNAMSRDDSGALEAEFEVLPDKPHGCEGSCGGDCGRCAGGFIAPEEIPEEQVITPEVDKPLPDGYERNPDGTLKWIPSMPTEDVDAEDSPIGHEGSDD